MSAIFTSFNSRDDHRSSTKLDQIDGTKTAGEPTAGEAGRGVSPPPFGPATTHRLTTSRSHITRSSRPTTKPRHQRAQKSFPEPREPHNCPPPVPFASSPQLSNQRAALSVARTKAKTKKMQNDEKNRRRRTEEKEERTKQGPRSTNGDDLH
ncbi:hypothetical protein GWI33_007854 [Rhynchophorus ferrugineus]|uniref:Uncharacterized protein n=1 Tax=Rhynchophorus ferrugineus TaxID=354439 RepID=A0A834IS78_RHYFE|nr:hypothetical protein GWI33_007854 [Rhynchophorus ferrugineus]